MVIRIIAFFVVMFLGAISQFCYVKTPRGFTFYWSSWLLCLAAWITISHFLFHGSNIDFWAWLAGQIIASRFDDDLRKFWKKLGQAAASARKIVVMRIGGAPARI